ncbi:MAG: HNH endonuclease [Rhodobacteraceae bacterium]|nr:HNH endonuclease [Paracoccaceae bacterium]
MSRHSASGQRWMALRALVLSRDRNTCQACGKHGRLEVDHVKPVRTHPHLRWNPANLQALCIACHVAKTNAELGRPEVAPARDKWRAAVRALERDGRKPSSERNVTCSTA